MITKHRRGLFVGVTTMDLIYPFSGFPEENTKNKTTGLMVDIGGPATNAAYTFAALGGKATLISLVGQNPMSTFIKERLNSYGIAHLDLNENYRGNPEIASILVNRSNGSRTVATAEPKLNPPTQLAIPDLSVFDVLCLDGFYGSYVLELLQTKLRKPPVVFDGGSFKHLTGSILPLVDYPIVSERFRFPGYTNAREYLLQGGFRQFAITRGENPILTYDDGRLHELPVSPVPAIDTLGAGDVFHGAFAYYLLDQEADFKRALSQAAVVAGLSCRYPGVREWTKHQPNFGAKGHPYSSDTDP